MKWKTNLKKTETANRLTSFAPTRMLIATLYIKAYFDEPIADEAWLDNYRKKREQNRERRNDFELLWDRTKPVSTWYTYYKINLFPLCDRRLSVPSES